MTQAVTSVSDVPNIPAVYAMFAGRGRASYVAYIGIANKLNQRLEQHLVRRSTSVTTGTSAVSLDPEYVTEVQWWEHPRFAERGGLEAGEVIAFRLLEPVLRSRGALTDRARELSGNPHFRQEMEQLFSGAPSGRLTILTLQDALAQIEDLQKRVAELEKLVQNLTAR